MSEQNKRIAEEMRQASYYSFPLSPGTMEGHYNVADLYWHFRQPLILGKTIEQIFETNDPKPIKLVVPQGHTSLTYTDGVNNTVWERFISNAFISHPKIDPVEKVRGLITVNASSDVKNFEKRLAGEKSKIALGGIAPSLLRAFVFEEKFPLNDNAFFCWLFSHMAEQIVGAHHGKFKESWSSGLQGLVLMWNAKFPNDPFIPDSKVVDK